MTPGIDRLPSGKYRVRVYVGAGRYKSKAFTRRKDAERWRVEMQAAKETGRVAQVDADLQTLRDLATEHMNAQRPELEERTWNTYKALWSAHVLTRGIADMALRAITPEVVEALRDDLRATGVGEQSIRKTLALMQTIMERAVRYGRIAANPVKAVKKPKAGRAKPAKPISPESVEAIRGHLSGANAVFVSVLAYGGLRPGEARALRWGDVRQRTIYVEEAADPDGSRKPTKTSKPRSVRLLAPLAADLAAWRRVAGGPADSALIFPRAGGGAWTEDDYRNFARRPFKRAAAGINIGSPYDLRHSAASLWLHEGINSVQVATWMGHSPAVLLGTYAHVVAELDPDDRSSAVDMIQKARRARDVPVTWIGDGAGQAVV